MVAQRVIQMIKKRRFKQVFTLYQFEGYDHKEIGEILEITENNAKVKSHRIIKKMKKLFDKI